MGSICSESRSNQLNHKPIFCSNPSIENRKLAPEIHKVIDTVLCSGNYILGEAVQSFEKDFAKYLNSKFAVGVNSGTDAIQIALKSLGLAEGDEVILPSHTAVATGAAVVSIGAVPVFAEVRPLSMTIDPESVKALN